MNNYTFDEIFVGMKAQFEVDITEEIQRKFMEISGDINPMHIDSEFAKAGGYKDRLVYGMCVASFYSQLVGVYLPGEHCLFRELDGVQWPRPVYIGDHLSVFGEIKAKDDRLNTVTIKAYIKNQDGVKVSRATIVCGVLGG